MSYHSLRVRPAQRTRNPRGPLLADSLFSFRVDAKIMSIWPYEMENPEGSPGGVFCVIPAKAGIQDLDPGSKPAPDIDPGSGVVTPLA